MVTAAGPEPRAHVQGGLFGARRRPRPADDRPRCRPTSTPTSSMPAQLAPQAGDPSLRLLKRVGRVDPTSLDAYRDDGGYRALHKALAMGPQAVIDEVTAAKLVGPGGAAFPTGRKWAAVAGQPAHAALPRVQRGRVRAGHVQGPGDPRARPVRARRVDDHRRVRRSARRAATCTCGASTRSPAPRLAAAIDQARRAGLLGDDVAGSGWSFDIELRIGAGAYIAGEETALFESIEGGRPEPRNKPPFPVELGLFGKPTAVNNVETLVNVPLILRDGGAVYATIGTEGSTGPKLFCVSGHVARPGVYETDVRVDAGRPDRAGRRRPGRPADPGDPAGRRGRARSSGRDALGTRLTFEGTRAAGATLGSGVVMVFDETADLAGRPAPDRRLLPRRVVRPVRPVPGRDRPPGGAARAAAAGRPMGSLDAELALFDDLARAMRDASICGLGQTASSAIESAIKGGLVHFDGRSGPAHDARPTSRRIYTELPARPTRVPEAPPRPRSPAVELTIDGAPVSVPAGSTILEAAAVGRHRHADAVLPREPDPGQRVPGVRGRGHRVARPRARLLAPGRGRDGGPDRQRARPPLAAAGPGAARARRSTSSLAGPAEPDGDLARYADAVRRRRDALRAAAPRRPQAGERDAREPGHHHAPAVDAGTRRRPRPSPSRSRSTTTCTSATTRAASSATSASRRAARTPRTRSRSRSPAAASTPGSRPSSTSRSRSPPASTAATASASARRAR